MTIFVRPAVIPWGESATLFGAARGATPVDVVRIQTRDCGSGFFREYAEAHVGPGGGWQMEVATGTTSTFRAVWRGGRSALVTVRQGARVLLERRRSGKGYLVTVSARRSLWRKTVEIQRRQGGKWRTLKTVALRDSVRSTGSVSASQAAFSISVPKKSRLRAVLPAAQAKPCYVRSVSREVRT